jgi:hypothetical protein
VKRTGITIFALVCSLSLFAQQPSSSQVPTTKQDRKTAKRARMNNMMRMEEEGVPSFRKQTVWGFRFNNDGYGGFYEQAKMKTPYRATIFQFEFNEKKHPKEDKQSTGNNLGGGFVVLGSPFVYGKQNIFYQFKGGIGQQIMIGGKGNKNGVAAYGIFAGGISLGLLRPYYIEVESPVGSSQFKKIRYSQADSAEFLGAGIVGGTGLSKGWNEIKVVPGLHAKIALRFDWARFNTTLSAIETGFNFEWYTKKIEQMVNVGPKNLFLNGYIAICFGSRK